ncbi:MAG TPA: DNA replication and repair protein RecF [Solirubrobacteraceae bacterium]|nr:DNA replication and repair protein RecF [Solirubrobacteraceae bacterium]
MSAGTRAPGGERESRVLGLQLRDFRTYARADARLGLGLTVVHGPNGAGKSNLLEALYFGCTARSMRTRNERELVRFGARAARVVVRVGDGARHHELSVGFEPAAGGERAARRMTYDGASVARLSDVAERPLMSVFDPDRLELVKGSPGARRAHLDQVVAAIWPARARDRRDYARALAQRNALLARIRSGGASATALSAWDRELAATALVLREHRRAAAELLAAPFAQRAAQLGCSNGTRLEYRPRSRARDQDEFVAELRARLELDVRRGFSSHGPHRDELTILRDGRELRVYGSQGEQRLALLALLLAERGVIASERRRAPVMLLDDVMSELDAERRELLAAELTSQGQSVIATTDLGHVPGSGDASVTRLRVSGGAVLQEALAA